MAYFRPFSVTRSTKKKIQYGGRTSVDDIIAWHHCKSSQIIVILIPDTDLLAYFQLVLEH
jgi:hypothetical protein